MTVRDDLIKVQELGDGVIKVEAAHSWAQNHQASALYKALEWDDQKAGYEFRLIQIRRLVAIHLVDVEEHREVLSLSIDRPTGGGYRKVPDIMSDAVLREVCLRDALAELERIKLKYEWLNELAGVWIETDKVKTRGRRGRRKDGEIQPTA